METAELRKKLEIPPRNGRQQAVLLSTGSLCPVHKGHLQILDIAARFLSEKCNVDPLVGYLSPSCDKYVNNKLGSDSISFKDRIEMVKLACNEHNQIPGVIHIYPDSWEGLQSKFINFPEVRNHFEEELKKLFPDKEFLVLYVTGADHFNRCGLSSSRGYVAISRVGYNIETKTDPRRNLYICNDPEYSEMYSDISSTAIRNANKKGQNIENLTYGSVVKYLREVLHFNV